MYIKLGKRDGQFKAKLERTRKIWKSVTFNLILVANVYIVQYRDQLLLKVCAKVVSFLKFLCCFSHLSCTMQCSHFLIHGLCGVQTTAKAKGQRPTIQPSNSIVSHYPKKLRAHFWDFDPLLFVYAFQSCVKGLDSTTILIRHLNLKTDIEQDHKVWDWPPTWQKLGYKVSEGLVTIESVYIQILSTKGLM